MKASLPARYGCLPLQVIFVHQDAIPGERNKAIWQRMSCISGEYKSWVITAGAVPGNLPTIQRIPLASSIQRARGPWAALRSRFRFSLSALLAVFRLSRKPNRRDVIYTFQTFELVLGAFLGALGWTWVVDIMDLPEFMLEGREEWQNDGFLRRTFTVWLLRCWVLTARLLLRRAHMVITLADSATSGYGRFLVERYHVKPDRLLTVRSGFDESLILNSNVPKESGSDGKPLRLIYVGALNEHLGTLFLLDVVHRVRREIAVLLVLVGGTTKRFEKILLHKIELLGLQGIVTWLGPLPNAEVIAEIDRADVGLFVMPQRCFHDGAIPAKVGEYMARGKVVLASDLTGMHCRIEHGKSGLLLPPGDIEAWTGAITRVAMDRAERESLRRGALAAAHSLPWGVINDEVLARFKLLARS